MCVCWSRCVRVCTCGNCIAMGNRKRQLNSVLIHFERRERVVQCCSQYNDFRRVNALILDFDVGDQWIQWSMFGLIFFPLILVVYFFVGRFFLLLFHSRFQTSFYIFIRFYDKTIFLCIFWFQFKRNVQMRCNFYASIKTLKEKKHTYKVEKWKEKKKKERGKHRWRWCKKGTRTTLAFASV